MIIQIRGVQFANKGAELMLQAVVAQLRARPKPVDICFAPRVGSYLTRSVFPHYQKFDIGRKAPPWLANIGAINRVLRTYGIVGEHDIDVILDASGFAIGDQWPVARVRRSATEFERARKAGSKVVLLPQAFGPFENAEGRKAAQRALAAAHLVYARDQRSFDFASALVPAHPALKLCPDFTNLLTGTPSDMADLERAAALVPNSKIMANGVMSRDAYVGFFVRAAGHLTRHGYDLIVLNHERDMDRALCDQLAAALPDARLLEPADALAAKGIMQRCAMTVGSRFHGLVNALSQGVPAIGTSWSHKYRALFEDYGHADWLLQQPEDDAALDRAIANIAANRDAYSKQLLDVSERLRERSGAMWSEVFATIAA